MASARRPYSRLTDSIWREPWPPRAKLSIYNLIAYLHERWRTDRLDADTMFPIAIGWREAALIFGGNSRAATLQGVEQVGCCITCSWTAGKEHISLSWPKWVIEQGIGSSTTPDRRPSASSVHRQRPEEEEELPSVDAEAASPPKDSPLLNLLSRLPGDRAEKAAFLAETGPQIEVDAATGTRSVPSLTVAYYRRYLAGDRRWKDASAFAALKADAARARADPAPEISAEASAAVRKFMAQATRRMEKPT